MFDQPRKQIDLSEIIKMLQTMEEDDWMWVYNTKCKYITISIDTRAGYAYSLRDRDGNEISVEDVMYQVNKQLSPLQRAAKGAYGCE